MCDNYVFAQYYSTTCFNRIILKRQVLSQKDKDNYIKFRDYYNNQDNSSINLFTLQVYAFQNMIRFNNSKKMNTPVGNNELEGKPFTDFK